MALDAQQRQSVRHPFRWLFEKEAREGEIPRKELFSYTLGLAGQNMLCGMAGGQWFNHFCTNVLKINPITTGKMIGAVTLFDALNDPVAGALIDNHRFKDGRKLLPWIKYTSPFIAVLAFLLFFNWSLPGTGPKVLYCIMVYVTWDVLYSFQDASLWGMTAAIHPASGQRARATQWADIGVLLGGLLPNLLMPMLSGGGAFGLTQQQVYVLFAAVLCLGGGFGTMFSLGMDERVRSLPEENKEDAGKSSAKGASLFQSIGALRHNYILLLFLASELLKQCAPNVSEAYIYQQMAFHVGGREISASLLVIIFGALTGLPGAAMKFFATKIADRVGGMKRVLVIACLTSIATRLLRYAIGIKSLPMFALGYLAWSIEQLPNSISNIAMRAMISDSVEYVEWKTGQRTEGITMSVRNLMSKASWSIQRYIQGYCLKFLDFNADKVERNVPQSPHFQKWVWPVHILGPAVGLALQLIPLLLLKYPDSLKRQVESEMLIRRQEAGVKDQDQETAPAP